MDEEKPDTEDLRTGTDSDPANTTHSRLLGLRIAFVGIGISGGAFDLAMAQIAAAGRREIEQAKQAIDQLVASYGLELSVYHYTTPTDWGERLKELALCECLVAEPELDNSNEWFRCSTDPGLSTKPTYWQGRRLFNRRARDAL